MRCKSVIESEKVDIEGVNVSLRLQIIDLIVLNIRKNQCDETEIDENLLKSLEWLTVCDIENENKKMMLQNRLEQYFLFGIESTRPICEETEEKQVVTETAEPEEVEEKEPPVVETKEDILAQKASLNFQAEIDQDFLNNLGIDNFDCPHGKLDLGDEDE